MNAGPMEVRVLFVDDSQPDVDAMLRVLRRGYIRGGWRRVSDPQELRETLASFKPAIVLAQFPTREFPGTEALHIVRAAQPGLPFVYAANAMSEEQTIQALREGAVDAIKRELGERGH